jgi:hypothetical protein
MMKDKLPNHLRAWRKRAGFAQVQVEKILGWPHGRMAACRTLKTAARR